VPTEDDYMDAGLRIDSLHEWPVLDWELPFLEKRGDVWVYPGPGELPLSFSLKASRPAYLRARAFSSSASVGSTSTLPSGSTITGMFFRPLASRTAS
jgi:hypothetical protein